MFSEPSEEVREFVYSAPPPPPPSAEEISGCQLGYCTVCQLKKQLGELWLMSHQLQSSGIELRCNVPPAEELSGCEEEMAMSHC